jgi:hypothetical protein
VRLVPPAQGPEIAPPSLEHAAAAISGATRASSGGDPFPTWEPLDRETHPLHEDVDDATRERGPDCYDLGVAIDVLVRDLRFRRWDMQRHGGGDAGHRTAYASRQRALAVIVAIARAQIPPCPYNPEADAEITRPHTYPTPRY